MLDKNTNVASNVSLYNPNTNTGTLDLGGGSIDTNYSVYVKEGVKLSSVEGTGAVAMKTDDGLDVLIAMNDIGGGSGSGSGTGSGSGSGSGSGPDNNDPYFANVVSLLDFNNFPLIDSISDNTWGGNGWGHDPNWAINIVNGELTSSSIQNTLSDQSRFDIHSGDFTIEFFYTPSA